MNLYGMAGVIIFWLFIGAVSVSALIIVFRDELELLSDWWRKRRERRKEPTTKWLALIWNAIERQREAEEVDRQMQNIKENYQNENKASQ
jgi:hypothetical protein